MVLADVGDHGDRAVAHVRGVVATEQSDLDDGDVDRDVGEPPQSGSSQQLEVRARPADQRLELSNIGQHVGQLVVVDRLAVPRDAFVDALQVRAGVGADGQAGFDQQCGDEAGGRALAVRAREVDDRIGLLRIAEHVDE